jgi:hypothetical protein
MLSSISGTTPLNTTVGVAPAASAATETKAPQPAQKDQVAISKLAQKLATDGDTQAQEVRESGAERSSEKARGKA